MASLSVSFRLEHSEHNNTHKHTIHVHDYLVLANTILRLHNFNISALVQWAGRRGFSLEIVQGSRRSLVEAVRYILSIRSLFH